MSKRKAESQDVSHERKQPPKQRCVVAEPLKANGALVQFALAKDGPLRIVWAFGSGLDWLQWRSLGKEWAAHSRRLKDSVINHAAFAALEDFRWSNATRLFDEYVRARFDSTDEEEHKLWREIKHCKVCGKVRVPTPGSCTACSLWNALKGAWNTAPGTNREKNIVLLKRIAVTTCRSYNWRLFAEAAGVRARAGVALDLSKDE
jgi:hypothetical protein